MISQGVMLRGASFASLWLPFLVLTVMAVVVFTGRDPRFRATSRRAPARTGEGPTSRPTRSASTS